MDKKEFESIKEKGITFKHNSFTYACFEEYGQMALAADSNEGLALSAFNEAQGLNEILWAYQDLTGFKEMAKSQAAAGTLFSFIPKEWEKELVAEGFVPFADMHDYWIEDISPFEAERKIDFALLSEALDVSLVTKDVQGQSREFSGESEEMIVSWLKGDEPNLADLGEKTKGQVIVAKSEGKIVGVALVAIYGFEYKKGPVCWVRELAVKKDFQNRGFGRKLLLDCLAYGKNNGAKRSYLAADDLNLNAVGLYKSVGYLPSDSEQLDMIYRPRGQK
jgi:GNAT superfamily N-acetyltransferase